ncbi:hypothetical protein [Actinotalea ferrariae]|nr:hypothetical protein [Actinotalea ferrariae]
MNRILRAAATVVVGLGLVGAALPVGFLPDAGVTSVGSTGCCRS